MIQDWINGQQSTLFSKEESPVEDIKQSLASSTFSDGKEVMLYHPNNSSIVKIKNNGMIDIFTSTNQGIRIDPIKHVVNILAEHEIHHLNNLTVWASKFVRINSKRGIFLDSGDSIIEKTKNNWTINVGHDATINAGGNVMVHSDKSMQLDANYINIKSQTDIRIEAVNNIDFKGVRYNHE